jgi:raffinose/stachyose/melibiose transport system substrate-binding protein
MRASVVRSLLCLAAVLLLLPALVWGTGTQEKKAEQILLKMGDNLPDRTGTWGAVVEQINAEFIKEHPNVRIETESYPDQPYQQKIKLYATSGQLPDVFKYWSFSTLLKPLVDAKLVAELNMADFKGLNYLAGALESNMYYGKLWGIPVSGDLWVVYYNKRLFKQAGVAVPETSDQVLAAIPKFKAQGLIPMSTDGKDSWPLCITWDNIIGRLTGDFSIVQAALDRKMKFTDPPFVQAAKVLQDMVRAGLFQADLVTSDYGASRNLFGQEKAAMYLMGSWELGLVTDQNFPQSFRDNISVFKFPLIQGGKGSRDDLVAWFGGNYVVNAGSKYKELGIEYLKFYAGRFPTLIWDKQAAVPAQRVQPTAKDSELAKSLLQIAADAKQSSGTPSLDRSTPAFKEDEQKFMRDLAALVLSPEQFARQLDASAETAAKQ